jgi:hypothetical protein
MSRTYYPSDEYDSRELESEAKRRARSWFGKWRRDDDDDDDPPPAPVAARRPRPIVPPSAAAVQAA